MTTTPPSVAPLDGARNIADRRRNALVSGLAQAGAETTLSDPLVQAFENTTIDPAAFHHREHLYVAWCYLRVLPLEDALARYVRHLRQLTIALGAPDKFHATITWAYLLVLDDVMARSPSAGFEDLLAKNPSLLSHPNALDSHYDRAVLASEEARRRFILPTRT